METSGATRILPLAAVPLGRVSASFAGTTPFWYQGWLKTALVPPPPPNCQPSAAHAEPVSTHASVPQTVVHSTLSCLPIATLVPPTEVAHASEVGKSACGVVEVSFAPQPVLGSSAPQSPAENWKLMPSIAPCWKVWVYSASTDEASLPVVE